MAEEVEGVEEVEASGGSKMPLVIFAVVAALLAGGGAAYLLLPAPAAEAKPKEKVTVGKILPVDSFIVNLNEAKATRYLKVTISVMLTDESLEEGVKLRMDILRDKVLTYLSGLTIDDVRGEDTKELIRERMLDLANQSLGEGEVVQQVLFKEFVVQ